MSLQDPTLVGTSNDNILEKQVSSHSGEGLPFKKNMGTKKKQKRKKVRKHKLKKRRKEMRHKKRKR